MARGRQIKPEFWTSAQIVACSVPARLLFIGIWNFADDAGRHQADPARLKMEVFPADAITPEGIAVLIAELVANGLLREYAVNGEKYLEVTGWRRHQVIRKPSFRFPAPEGLQFGTSAAPVTHQYGTSTEPVRQGYGSGTDETETETETEAETETELTNERGGKILREGDNGIDNGSNGWDDAIAHAVDVIRPVLGTAKRAGDMLIAYKAAYLDQAGLLPPGALLDAVNAVKTSKPPPTNRWAYFTRCLENKAGGKTQFGYLLASVTVPDRYLGRFATNGKTRK